MRVSVPEVFLHPGAHGYREENHGHRFRGGVAGVACVVLESVDILLDGGVGEDGGA